MTKHRFVELCQFSGFESFEPGKLPGANDDDELIYADDVPCGDKLFNLASRLGIEIE